MPLTTGATLGPYVIEAAIGAGGMGEVYRATDTRLKRKVAVKVLPEAVGADAARLARFQREAELLASLNHPHVAHVYGVEESSGLKALVMELVEGPTLAERIAGGPIPFADALSMAKQIAEGLEAAHEQGIVHRDLKPANIKLTTAGSVKVLDFGLAKAMETDRPTAPDVSQSPTVTTPAMTAAGIILGTAAYMSPEQARGLPVDKRADIWAFGCVLYELFSGRAAFRGTDASETLAHVLTGEIDLTALRAGTPDSVRRLARRCLERNPRQRLRDIGEARIALETPEREPALVAGPPFWRRAVPAGALVLTLAGLVALATWIRARPAPRDVVRLSMVLAPEAWLDARTPLRDVAISADGRRIVYTRQDEAGVASQLQLRATDQMDGIPVRGSEGGGGPFLSPDGEWVGFVGFVDSGPGRLVKVAASGGTPIQLAAVSGPIAGASWGRDDQIVFGSQAGLYRVGSAGGEPEALTTIDLDRGEIGHGWPFHLPGSRAVLFVIGTGDRIGTGDQLQVTFELAVLDLGTRQLKRLGLEGTNPQYASTGHLVYAGIDGTLRGVRFNASSLEVSGSPVPLQEGVVVKASGAADFVLSDNGRLAYVSGASGLALAPPRRLVWVDRQGREEALDNDWRPDQYVYPRVSPDGTQVALAIALPIAAILTSPADLWILDLARGSRSRVTFGGNNRFFPVWAPDGSQLAYTDSPAPGNRLMLAPTDGSGEPEVLLTSQARQFPTSWTRDGSALAIYIDRTGRTGRDLAVLPMDGSQRATDLLVTPFQERAPVFSPDGRWVAYVSDESGRDEVYVRAYPGPGQQYTISASGGTEPVWSRDGRELFFRNGSEMFTVDVNTTSSFRASPPGQLFVQPYVLDNSGAGIGGIPNYDVSPDGERFLMLKEVRDEVEASQIRIVLNWSEELSRLVSTGR